jgi:hypothetical protein
VRDPQLLLSKNDPQFIILKHQEEVLVVEDSAEAVPEGREEMSQRGALHQNLCILAERLQAVLEARVAI